MSNGPGSKQPFHRLSADDRGPLIIIVAYSWIFITFIVTLIRFSLAWKQRMRVDDGVFLLGVAFATSSSIFAHLAANGGLGKRIVHVNNNGLDKFYKMIYAAELTGIIAMAAAKTSIVLLSHRVAPRKPRSYFLMLLLVAFWTMFSSFALGFQCDLPHPWVYVPSQCPARRNILYPIVGFNILTDALLATWILPTLFRLLMDTSKRTTVVVLFGARLIVCCFGIVQLVSVARHIRNPDVTFASFGNILWGICVIHLSVLFATIPRTNRFIESLQTMHTSTLLTEFELANPNGGGPNVLPKRSPSTSGAITTTTTKTHIKQQSRSKSHSPSRNNRTEVKPLVDMPLKLTPSVKQNFTTHMTSHEGQQQSQSKYHANDWRKYLHRSKHDEEMNMASMFSWNSRSGHGHERAVQSSQATQEVDFMPPKESRWKFSKPRRLDRGVRE